MFPDLEFIKTCLNGLRSRIEQVEAQTANIQILKAQIDEIRGTIAPPKDPYVVYSTDSGGAITAALYNFESIPDYLFNGEQITKVDLSGCPKITSIGKYVFYNCVRLTSVTIPEGVTTIGVSAFRYCTSLTSIIIPESVTSIGDNAFQDCTGLTSVTILGGVTTIGASAFANCTRLNSVTIMEGVTSIGSYAFSNCTSLTSVTIPKSVTSIGSYAFRNCSGITEYHLKPATPPTLSNKNAFTGIPADCIIYVPQGCLEAYQNATNWATYASKMQEEPA